VFLDYHIYKLFLSKVSMARVLFSETFRFPVIEEPQIENPFIKKKKKKLKFKSKKK